MTISIYDLEILTDAMVFAVLVTIAGVASWAVGRELSRRHGPRRDVRVALAGAALIAVGSAGVAVRSMVGDALPVVARVASAPVEDRVEERPALRLDVPRSRSDDGTTDGSTRTGDDMRSVPAAGSAGTAGPGDDPGTIPGSDGIPSPPPVDVEPSDDPPQEPSDDPSDDPPQEPPDDPPQEPPDDPPQEPPDDPPDEEPSDDPSPAPEDEGPSGQGPDGQGPPGQGGGGPPGQGPDGNGPPGQGGGP
jgi:hypothetical protein